MSHDRKKQHICEQFKASTWLLDMRKFCTAKFERGNDGRAGTRTLIWEGGGGMFLYSCNARLISFEINLKKQLISKEISRAEHEYMNIHPPINILAPALEMRLSTS